MIERYSCSASLNSIDESTGMARSGITREPRFLPLSSEDSFLSNSPSRKAYLAGEGCLVCSTCERCSFDIDFHGLSDTRSPVKHFLYTHNHLRPQAFGSAGECYSACLTRRAMTKKGGVRHAHKGGKHASKRALKQNDKGK